MSFAETPSPDEDKWRLRERMLEVVQPLKDKAQDDIAGTESTKLDRERFATLFRPRPPAQIERSPLLRAQFWLRSLFSPQPLGVNDNGNDAARGATWRSLTTSLSSAIARIGQRLHRRSKGLAPYFIRTLRPRLGDVIALPLALIYFIIPLLILNQIDPAASPTRLSLVLIGSTLITPLIFGPRFGTIAMLSAYTWLCVAAFPLPPTSQTVERLAHWIVLIFGGVGLATLGIGIGLASNMMRDLMKLALKIQSREAEIAEFQTKLRRVHHVDALLHYIVSYCRDRFGKRVIFLALEEGSSYSDEQAAFDIASQLKSAGYARVIVDRSTYLPRAMMSFKSSGYDAYPLETPSGTIALLGIDQSDGRKLSTIDARYLRLFLVTASYALERIFLKEKLNTLEEDRIEFKARNAAMMSIVGNLTNTVQNLDDQAYGLHQLLDREAHKPYDTAINFIRRNISALRNSVALLRDVAN